MERAEIDQEVAGKTLCSVFAEQVAALRDAPALLWRDAAGAWQPIS
jgi:hypothetical protein